jgi:hypothetical protein
LEDLAASFMMPGDLLCSHAWRQHAHIDSRRATHLT